MIVRFPFDLRVRLLGGRVRQGAQAHVKIGRRDIPQRIVDA